MLCENCGKNTATTHIKRSVNGVFTEKHLCTECAAKLGYSVGFSDGFAEILSSMFGDTLPEKSAGSVKCSCCNTAFSDIVKTGKMGCPECYNAFYEQLLPYLKRIHGNVNHIGKMPNSSPLAVSNDETRILSLKRELNKLIVAEEFEKAAQIRDEIRKLEGKGGKNE